MGAPRSWTARRAVVAMAVTATLRAQQQLGWHVRGALRAGVTPDEVREVLIAVAGLAGFPAAWTAMEVAQPILAEHEAGAGGEGTP